MEEAEECGFGHGCEFLGGGLDETVEEEEKGYEVDT